ncbi:hypothetical protein FXO38_03891 [Capsicum annuum]|nr:hypothetical protein FXO37_12752 [Capsicum annuum]KAF3677241.1 hypothetical protein FXO38_03891 [Capsicum annuum]
METITTMENKTPPYFFKQEMKATMDLQSGFTKSLDKTVAEGISIVDTFRQDHDQREAGETTIRGAGDAVLPVKRCSLRQRVPLNPFVPNYYRPDGRGQGSRRGPGRPPKQRADATGSLALRPLQGRPGRPRKQRSDGETTPSPAPCF